MRPLGVKVMVSFLEAVCWRPVGREGMRDEPIVPGIVTHESVS